MESDNQKESKRLEELYAARPWLWRKGQSGNPKGRKKGKTLKEYAKDFLSKMTDAERQEFMQGLDKEVIWKMAEGNPKQDTELSNPDGNLKTIIIQKSGSHD